MKLTEQLKILAMAFICCLIVVPILRVIALAVQGLIKMVPGLGY